MKSELSLTSLGHGFQKILPVHVIQKNGFPSIPSVSYTADGSGIFYSQLARHGWNHNQEPPIGNAML
jgi:hypothetical protein